MTRYFRVKDSAQAEAAFILAVGQHAPGNACPPPLEVDLTRSAQGLAMRRMTHHAAVAAPGIHTAERSTPRSSVPACRGAR